MTTLMFLLFSMLGFVWLFAAGVRQVRAAAENPVARSAVKA
ncbi:MULTISPECIES: hypothetical protein [Saccharothrix]|nr:hypothetical protein [Saccharothrix sp. CB00851]